MPSQRHIEETGPEPDLILAAARSCVMDVGLRRTTLADVARRAGVSRMTVYRQWNDLPTIVGALLTTELLGLMETVSAEVAHLPTGRARLVEAAALTATRVVHHPLYRKVLDTDPELLLPLVFDRFGSTQQAAIDLVGGQIAEGQTDGSIRPGDPALLSTCLLLTAQSFVFSARVVETAHQASQTDAELRRLLEGYLR